MLLMVIPKCWACRRCVTFICNDGCVQIVKLKLPPGDAREALGRNAPAKAFAILYQVRRLHWTLPRYSQHVRSQTCGGNVPI